MIKNDGADVFFLNHVMVSEDDSHVQSISLPYTYTAWCHFHLFLFHLRNCSSNIWSEAQLTLKGNLNVSPQVWRSNLWEINIPLGSYLASSASQQLLFDSRPAQIQGGQVFPCILAKALPASLSYLCSPHLHLMPKTSRPLLRVTAPQVVLDSSPLLSLASAGGQFCNTGVIKHYG